MSDVKEKRRQVIEGLVSSDAMDKTIVVSVTRLVKHPVMHKYVKKFTRYYAHDEANVAKKGDTVEIKMCKPLSKKKRWRLVKVTEAAK
jgi:small subunit ribosomal protein S17